MGTLKIINVKLQFRYFNDMIIKSNKKNIGIVFILKLGVNSVKM